VHVKVQVCRCRLDPSHRRAGGEDHEQCQQHY
jgi:hypothetical protein